MHTREDLRVMAHHLLGDAELAHREVIGETQHPEDFGDGEVIFEVGPMHLRFVRQRGQDFVDVSPASAPGRYYPFGDVELALGWKTVEEVWSASEPEPLRAILERLQKRYSEFEDAFSSARAQQTLAKLEFASRRREGAFLENLRRIADDARKKK